MNLGTIMLILSSLATVIQLVEVELGAGTGAEKKQAVIDAITKLCASLNVTLPAILTANWGIIVDMIVALYNLTSPLFGKKK